MDIKSLHQLFLDSIGVVTDTRKVQPGVLFFALKGDRFDANAFAAEALQSGASFAIIDASQYFIDERTLLVPDVLQTLQELARHHREYLGLPIIGLTGSNGKTTTKELLHAVLSQKYKTGATVGNLNNHIGVPLTLLSFDADTEIGIVEMGANHQKEIEFLCEIARPDYGYITNFGKAHLEGFGGVEGVIKGKSELYAYLENAHKMAFVNLSDAVQTDKTPNIQRFTFGLNQPEADLNVTAIQADPFATIQTADCEIVSHLIGAYNATNIMAAMAIGKYFGIDSLQIKEAIENYVPSNNRSQLINKNSREIILDAYNANPSSMTAAVQNFATLEKSDKFLILGDMFELGEESLQEHAQLISSLIQYNLKAALIGKDFYASKIAAENLEFYPTFEAFAQAAPLWKSCGKTLLIKGSRGMALERVLDLLD